MNEYIEVIKSAIIFFPLVTFFFTMPFILHNYHKYISTIKGENINEKDSDC